MSHPGRRHLPRPQVAQTDPSIDPVVAPTTALRSDSVPTGRIRLSGIVKTKNGYATAMVDLTPAEWEALTITKRIGQSQTFKEHIAVEHKKMVLRLGQMA